MATPQHAVFLIVDGERFPLSLDETRDVIVKLRSLDSGNPHLADAQLAAAIFLERLVDELDVQNPTLKRREWRAIGLALVRLEVSEGLTARQERLRDALVAWDIATPDHDEPSAGDD